MKNKASRILVIFLIIQIVMSCIAPVTVYANDATMLEPLIEPNTKTYKVDIVSDSPGWFSQHYENKHISFYNYYNDICSTSISGATRDMKAVVTELRTNPAYCMGMDDNLKLDSYGGTSGGYKFFLAAEGYHDGTNMINDDTKIKDITTNNSYSFAGDKNDFVQGKSDGMKVLTFPAMHGSGAKDVTQAETEYAIEIGNTLGESLNSMLAMLNGGKRYGSVSELVNKSILMRPTDKGYTIVQTGTDTGYLIVYGSPSNWGDKVVRESESRGSKLTSGNFSLSSFSGSSSNYNYPNADNNGNLLAYIIPFKGTINSGSYTVSNTALKWDELSTFIWAMPKGYAKIEGIDNSLKFTNDKHEEYSFVADGNDTPWITIHHISMYANNAYKNHNVSIATKTSSTDSGNWFMTIIVEFFQTLLQGLRTVLGLSDMHTLVYNKGARSSSSWNYGAMNDAWWTVVLRYHLIFQSLAWFLIICGFIKILIDLNLSTINPGKRVSAIQTVQRFVVVGFLLVTVIPIIQFMLNMNSSIVQIFASQVDPNASEAPVIASLAGLVLQFAYFGICVYINFTYIMRSVIIGILTVTAPFFIASMAFSQSNKQLFDSWLREITANIFMQSIHAFSLAFLTNLVATGGGLESLVVSYSIIPLTELVRNLVFQGAGSHASNLGMAAGSKFLNAAQGMGNTLIGAAAGKISDKVANGGEKMGGGEGQGQGGGAGAGNMGKSSKVEQLSAQLSQNADSAKGGVKEQAKSAGGKSIGQNAKMASLNLAKAGLNMGNMMMGAMNVAMDMAGAEMTGNTAGYSSAGTNAAKAAMDGGKGLGNAALGAAEAGAGVGKAVGSIPVGGGRTIGGQVHKGVQAVGNAAKETGQAIAGSKAGQVVGGAGRKVGGAVGHAAGAVAGWAGQARDGYGESTGREDAAAGSESVPNPSRNIMGYKASPSGSSGVTRLASENGGTFSNDNGGGVNETMSMKTFNNAASTSGVHRLVQASMNGHTGAEKTLKDMGITYARDGGNVRINYGREYMRRAGFEKVNAANDGRSLFIQTSGTNNPVQSFTGMDIRQASGIINGANPSMPNPQDLPRPN